MPHPLPHAPARSIPTALLPLQCKILITARQVSPSWMLTAQSSDLFQPRRTRGNKSGPQNDIKSASQKAETYGRNKQQVLQTPGPCHLRVPSITAIPVAVSNSPPAIVIYQEAANTFHAEGGGGKGIAFSRGISEPHCPSSLLLLQACFRCMKPQLMFLNTSHAFSLLRLLSCSPPFLCMPPDQLCQVRCMAAGLLLRCKASLL